MYIHFQIVAQAVLSLGKILIRRNLPADQFRSQQILSISGNPTVILNPNLSGELPCETLSLETITRWILCEYTYKLLISPVKMELRITVICLSICIFTVKMWRLII